MVILKNQNTYYVKYSHSARVSILKFKNFAKYTRFAFG